MKQRRNADLNLANPNPSDPSRRRFIKKTAAAAVIAAAPAVLTRSAFAAGRPIKIGLVAPRTGPLAAFGEADEFCLAGVRKIIANGIVVNGVNHPVQFLYKDSMSDPNRAAEVASELIKSDKIDLMTVKNTADTVNPVSDQAEINGVPCVSTSTPWQAYFFGRGGKPNQGFDWTYHFYWGLEDMAAAYISMWNSIPNNRTVGALWPNDAEGNTYANPEQGFPNALKAKGFKLVDSGRFQPTTNDFSAQINLFKSSQVDILTGVLAPPAFATFWSQAAQQGFRPKIVTFAKALLFPAALNALGDRGTGLSSEVWWSPGHPFQSGLTGQTSAAFCAQYEHDTGRQWTQPMGFTHALLEVALDVLKRTKNVDSPESIRDAIRSTSYNSLVGHVQWTGNPVKNVTKTPLVGGQWVRGKKYKYDLLIVNNDGDKDIPVQASLKPIVY